MHCLPWRFCCWSRHRWWLCERVYCPGRWRSQLPGGSVHSLRFEARSIGFLELAGTSPQSSWCWCWGRSCCRLRRSCPSPLASHAHHWRWGRSRQRRTVWEQSPSPSWRPAVSSGWTTFRQSWTWCWCRAHSLWRRQSALLKTPCWTASGPGHNPVWLRWSLGRLQRVGRRPGLGPSYHHGIGGLLRWKCLGSRNFPWFSRVPPDWLYRRPWSNQRRSCTMFLSTILIEWFILMYSWTQHHTVGLLITARGCRQSLLDWHLLFAICYHFTYQNRVLMLSNHPASDK